MYRFEKENPKIKRFEKKSFHVVFIFIVIDIIFIILASILIEGNAIVFVAAFLEIPLAVAFFILLFMKVYNKFLDAAPKEGQQEFIEFYSDHLVICERQTGLSHQYNYCKIYYDEIERTYVYKEPQPLFGKHRPDSYRYMNISIQTNPAKSMIKNHQYGNRYTFHVEFNYYPQEMVPMLLTDYRDIMKITERYHTHHSRYI